MGPVAGPGLVTGLHGEAALIGKHFEDLDRRPMVGCFGPGAISARRAADDLIAKGAGGLVSFGFAGGIDKTIAPGSIVLASEIRSGRQETLPTNSTWRQAVRSRLGSDVEVIEAPIAAVDKIVTQASDKTRLRYKTGAVAIDMESLAVGQAAADADLPFIVIRAVCDPALQSLPVMALEAVDENGRLRLWKIFFSLVRHPGQLGELRRLALNTRSAANALGTVCRRIAPGFCLPDFRGVLIRQLREAGEPHS